MSALDPDRITALKGRRLTVVQIVAATIYRALAKAEAVSTKRTCMKPPQ